MRTRWSLHVPGPACRERPSRSVPERAPGLASLVDPSGLPPREAREALALALEGERLWDLGVEQACPALRAAGVRLVRRALERARRPAQALQGAAG